MKRIQLGKSDLMVSQIALGCMGLGGEWDAKIPLTKSDEVAAIKAVEAALEQGINFFDHADIYKGGKAEAVFSSIWDAKLVDRESIFIQSKCGIRLMNDLYEGSAPHYDFSYEHIMHSVDGILSRLKVDYLDSLLLHRPDTLMEPEEVAKAFSKLPSLYKLILFLIVSFNNLLLNSFSSLFIGSTTI